MRPVLNSKGISIIEVMVSIGILAVVGTAMMTMMQNMNKSVAYASAAQDFNALRSELLSIISNSTSCQNAFSVTPNFDFKQASGKGQPVSLQVGPSPINAGVNYGAVQVQELKLVNAQSSGVAAGVSYYRADLWLKVKALPNVIGSSQLPGKVVGGINLSVSAAGAIQSCGSTGSLMSQLWQCDDSSGMFFSFFGGASDCCAGTTTFGGRVRTGRGGGGGGITVFKVATGTNQGLINVPGLSGSTTYTRLCTKP